MDLVPRDYQIEACHAALKGNTIVNLPTGTGKTLIAALTHEQMNSKFTILCCASVAVIEQHQQFFRSRGITNNIIIDTAAGLKARIFDFGGLGDEDEDQMTDQEKMVYEQRKQFVNQRIKDIDLLIFDECHHAIGHHPYVKLAKLFQQFKPEIRILGLTASFVHGTFENVAKKRKRLEENLSCALWTPSSEAALSSLQVKNPDKHFYKVDYKDPKNVLSKKDIERRSLELIRPGLQLLPYGLSNIIQKEVAKSAYLCYYVLGEAGWSFFLRDGLIPYLEAKLKQKAEYVVRDQLQQQELQTQMAIQNAIAAKQKEASSDSSATPQKLGDDGSSSSEDPIVKAPPGLTAPPGLSLPGETPADSINPTPRDVVTAASASGASASSVAGGNTYTSCSAGWSTAQPGTAGMLKSIVPDAAIGEGPKIMTAEELEEERLRFLIPFHQFLQQKIPIINQVAPKVESLLEILESCTSGTVVPTEVPNQALTGPDGRTQFDEYGMPIQARRFDVVEEIDQSLVFVERAVLCIPLAKIVEMRTRRTTKPVMGVQSMSADERNAYLNLFKQGKVRVIVATSSLEEGIDVADCKVVVRFDYFSSVRSHIQGSGRARHPDAKIFYFEQEPEVEEEKAALMNMAARDENAVIPDMKPAERNYHLSAMLGEDQIIPGARGGSQNGFVEAENRIREYPSIDVCGIGHVWNIEKEETVWDPISNKSQRVVKCANRKCDAQVIVKSRAFGKGKKKKERFYMFGGPDNPWICADATEAQIKEAEEKDLLKPPVNPIVSLKKEKEDDEADANGAASATVNAQGGIQMVEGVPVMNTRPKN